MSKNIRNESTDGLFQAILSLQDMDECYTFFEDVCTINEIQSLAQRFEVARLLREKKTYLEIAERTGASTATISRVNRSLNYGNDGSRRTKRHKRIDNVRSACCVRAQQADLFKGEDKYSTSLWYIYSIPVRWKDIHDPDGKNSQITKKTCYVVLNTI